MIVLRRSQTRDTVTRSVVGMPFITSPMPQIVDYALDSSAAPREAATELQTLSYSTYGIVYGPLGGPGHAAAAIGVEKGLSEGFSG